jgi:putative ABC transport system permease protein
MFFNYFKIAIRKSWKNKVNTFIKLISLSIGIVSLFYISIYIHEEFSYDNFLSKKSNIYRLNTDLITATGTVTFSLSATPVAEYLKSTAPEIVEYVRITKEYGSHSIRFGDKLFSEKENIYYADYNFFNLFDYNLLRGNMETALKGPDKIIISEKMANKYFGSTDALNKALIYDGEGYMVTGIVEDIPVNSQLQFEFLISMETFLKTRPSANENWSWFPMNTYLLLTSPEAVPILQQKLRTIPKYLPENTPTTKYVVTLESLEGLHFSEAKLGDLSAKGSLSNVYILLTIGIMILLLAVSNYINLSIAQSSVQGKEVSVKKTLGASSKQIFNQFFIDSVILSLFASILSVIVIAITLRRIEYFMGHAFNLSFMRTPLVLTIAMTFPLVLSMLSGLYPSLRFSNISPIIAQKEEKTSRKSMLNLRTGLLMFQFTITSALIIGTSIIYNQLSFIKNKELGINIEKTLVIDYGPNSEIGNSFEALKAELGRVPGVNSVAFSSHIPGQIPNLTTARIIDSEGQIRNGEMNLTLIDYDFIDNFGLSMVAGRGFSKDRVDSDITSALIMNESAVAAYGYNNPEDILGTSFEQWGGDGIVIGVVKDFNYLSLHNTVGLLSLKLWPGQFQKISVKIGDTNIQQVLTTLQTKWESLYPDIPFNYYFTDDVFSSQYAKDQQFTDIISILTGISFTIGILGMIAFATFWCERKKNEISIRKVLGADSSRLMLKFLRRFSTPVLISFAVAVPFAFYYGGKWVQQFAYQIDLDWTLLLIPFITVMIIVGLSVGFQSLKVVLANPVDNLKNE